MATDDAAKGGSFAAQHSTPARTPLNVAPTDGSTKFNTIRIPLIPQACWRLNDPGFAFDSSFVSPSFKGELVGADPPASHPHAGLTTLNAVVTANQGCPAALFAHCDPAGDDALNKTLGDRRGISVYGLLTRQPKLWSYLYDNPQVGDTWDLHMVQTMLAAVVDGQGTPYYGGAIDGLQGSGATADGDPGSKTRELLFGAYMDWLCTPAGTTTPLRLQPTDFLGGAGAQPGDLPKISLQSCGKLNPVVLLTSEEMNQTDKATRNEDDGPNRRVVLFFFPKGTTVDSTVWPCPKVKEGGSACTAAFWPDGDQRRKNGDTLREYRTTRDTMACRFYDRFARRSPCERARVPRPCFVYAQLMDDALDSPLTNASWTLQGKRGSSFQGTTDGQGNMRQDELPDDVLEVQCSGLTELTQVYYTEREDDLGDQPWVLRMRKASS
jgi:hypothetical protein